MNTKTLLYTGTIIPVIFWLSTIICGFVHGGYNHLSRTISELGAMGTRSEPLMATLTMFGALLSIFFIIGVYRACKQLNISVVPVFTLPAFTVMMGWAAMFHSGNKWHATAGPVFLLLYVGAFLVVVLWRGRKELMLIRLLSLVSLALMLLIFLRFMPGIENNYPGLIQRFVHLGWSVWFTALSIGLIRLVSLQEQKQLFIR
ncbi:DUF998 domain-containing protein [Mucilaginibacter pocheonensis]|uniref:Membrane protein n=1 Tax=Mucilaginibacter pocheonensis TaxID=398050 RepID=A0ABU1TIR3_9SPHI|nr:DUF998 domain-containing protein [Mucilaginibacter pocheonensis]MDR6945253.1 putative membrane protein [Mucilaginibacter pocheonensis]